MNLHSQIKNVIIDFNRGFADQTTIPESNYADALAAVIVATIAVLHAIDPTSLCPGHDVEVTRIDSAEPELAEDHAINWIGYGWHIDDPDDMGTVDQH